MSRVKPCATCGHPKSRHRTHEYRVDTPAWVPYCTCGWTADETHDVRAYDEHIVAVVLDHERPRIEAEIREQKARSGTSPSDLHAAHRLRFPGWYREAPDA